MSFLDKKVFFFLSLFIFGCGSDLDVNLRRGNSQTPISMDNVEKKGWVKGARPTFFLSKDLPEAIKLAAPRAAESWNRALGERMLAIRGETSLKPGSGIYDTLSDNFSVIYALKDGWQEMGKTDATLATAVFEYNEAGHLHKADVIMNTGYFWADDAIVVSGDSKEPSCSGLGDKITEVDYHEKPREEADCLGRVDAESILLHELGHVLGLKHTDDPQDVMYPKFTVNNRMVKRELSEADVAQLLKLYRQSPAP